ncbi:MAG: stimulus-sensing domain-containing protein [Maricaulaceae bacterium]
MASDIAIKTSNLRAGRRSARARRALSVRRRRPLWLSRLARQILAANLAGLLVLVAGVFVLGETRRGLIEARIGSLMTQAELVAAVLADAATDDAPQLDVVDARRILRRIRLPDTVRTRIYDAQGVLISDSFLLNDQILVRPLPPPDTEQGMSNRLSDALERVRETMRALAAGREGRARMDRTIADEVGEALTGTAASGERTLESGERVVSVAVPIQRVQAVVAVVTMEAGGLGDIIAAERRAMVPIALVAIGVPLASAVLLTVFIAGPIRRLALAADRIRTGGARRARIPDLSGRGDEIGDLSQSLEAMTAALYDRLDANERFAADVAHELKNPITSMRSALEILPAVKDEERKSKLLKVMNTDVRRLDRLISDIANASRIDVELARERAGPVDVTTLLADLAELYNAVGEADRARVRFEPDDTEAIFVDGVEAGLGRVLRNLIDNALSFSPPRGEVRLGVARTETEGVACVELTVEDDGPGVPPANLESIFNRFYTERPKGAAFGSHSGLGLAIARQITHAHHGRIYAENRVDEEGRRCGARFVVRLPEHLT